MAEKFLSYLTEADFSEYTYNKTVKIAADKGAISDLRFTVGQDLQDAGFKYRNLFLVALDEIITNIAEHGLEFDKTRSIEVAIYAQHPVIGVVLEDQGSSFDPRKKRAKSPKRQFAKGADGGYGMYIYKRVFHKIDYSTEKKTNRMVLYFNDKKVKLPS